MQKHFSNTVNCHRRMHGVRWFTRKLNFNLIYMARRKLTHPRSIGRSLNFTTGRMNALCEKLLNPVGISLPQWVILSCLWREGELAVGTLAELVGAGFSATSRIVDRMVDRGLVVRRRHESDGRVIVVRLTEEGDKLRHLSDFYRKINTALFEGFSQEERELAFSLLSRMQKNAETALEAETKRVAQDN